MKYVDYLGLIVCSLLLILGVIGLAFIIFDIERVSKEYSIAKVFLGYFIYIASMIWSIRRCVENLKNLK